MKQSDTLDLTINDVCAEAGILLAKKCQEVYRKLTSEEVYRDLTTQLARPDAPSATLDDAALAKVLLLAVAADVLADEFNSPSLNRFIVRVQRIVNK